ncbi:MAG: DUF2523 domain-containing protein [Methylomonas sp.]|nr:DUF2523 domain-containing protein [Methylomonas sp.]
MTTLSNFLIGIAGSLTARVMISLGFGIVSYAALTAVASNVVSDVQSNYLMLDPSVMAVLNLAGGGQALGIICGGLVTSAALGAFKRFQLQ